MLLFSTILAINDTLTQDKFIELAIEWNQKSLHAENVIPDLVWNGERNIRFGSFSVNVSASHFILLSKSPEVRSA